MGDTAVGASRHGSRKGFDRTIETGDAFVTCFEAFSSRCCFLGRRLQDFAPFDDFDFFGLGALGDVFDFGVGGIVRSCWAGGNGERYEERCGDCNQLATHCVVLSVRGVVSLR